MLNKILCWMWGCHTIKITLIKKIEYQYLFTDALICKHCGAPKHDN